MLWNILGGEYFVIETVKPLVRVGGLLLERWGILLLGRQDRKGSRKIYEKRNAEEPTGILEGRKGEWRFSVERLKKTKTSWNKEKSIAEKEMNSLVFWLIFAREKLSQARALWIFCSYFSLHCPSCIFFFCFSFHSLLGCDCSVVISFSLISLEAIVYMGSYESCWCSLSFSPFSSPWINTWNEAQCVCHMLFPVCFFLGIYFVFTPVISSSLHVILNLWVTYWVVWGWRGRENHYTEITF